MDQQMMCATPIVGARHGNRGLAAEPAFLISLGLVAIAVPSIANESATGNG